MDYQNVEVICEDSWIPLLVERNELFSEIQTFKNNAVQDSVFIQVKNKFVSYAWISLFKFEREGKRKERERERRTREKKKITKR